EPRLEPPAAPAENRLAPLRPPPSKHGRDLLRRRLLERPRLRRWRKLLDGCFDQLQPSLRRLRPPTRVRQQDGADPLSPRVDQHRDEPRKAARVPAENPVAAPPELDPEPPAERPVALGHDLNVVHPR